MTFTITMIFPPKELSPNARVHWGKKSRVSKKYRADCHWLAKDWIAHNVKPVFPEGDIPISLEFIRPRRDHYDDDNLEAAFKSGRDGLADALGVDDNRFKVVSRSIAAHAIHGGEVKVTFITPSQGGGA